MSKKMAIGLMLFLSVASILFLRLESIVARRQDAAQSEFVKAEKNLRQVKDHAIDSVDIILAKNRYLEAWGNLRAAIGAVPANKIDETLISEANAAIALKERNETTIYIKMKAEAIDRGNRAIARANRGLQRQR